MSNLNSYEKYQVLNPTQIKKCGIFKSFGLQKSVGLKFCCANHMRSELPTERAHLLKYYYNYFIDNKKYLK